MSEPESFSAIEQASDEAFLRTLDSSSDSLEHLDQRTQIRNENRLRLHAVALLDKLSGTNRHLAAIRRLLILIFSLLLAAIIFLATRH